MNGTSCATFSCASWLSMVTADGVAIRLVFESPCSARIIAAKFTPVAAMRPIPKVVPCRAPARPARHDGLSTACRELREVDARRPATGTCPPECACRRSRTTRPSSRRARRSCSTCTSTMMASTSTCARRMSSLSTTALSERMTLAGAVITSALVSGSAQMVVERSALAPTPPPPAAPPRRCAARDGHGGADLFLELGGDLFRVGELQVDAPACRRRFRAACRGARPAP